MERKIYAEENGIALAEYVFELDEKDIYDCWRDESTESGYNNHAAPAKNAPQEPFSSARFRGLPPFRAFVS